MRLVLAALFVAACGPRAVQTQQPDAGTPDAGPDACTPAPRPAVIGPGSVVAGSAAGHFLVRGRIVTPDVVFDKGEVLVSGDSIACVAEDCSADPAAAGATVIESQGVVYPGLVDAHNHTQYNYLRPWKAPRLFQNRYQWAALASYKAAVASVNANEVAHVCEQVKYGEVRALVGGTTTIQGTFNANRFCFRTLVHNAEYGNELGPDLMRTNIGGVDSINATDAQTIRAQMLDGTINAYVIHLAEGVDQSSRDELTSLETKGLLLPPIVIIHGTAFGASEFARVAAAGARLVWSPLSNLALYGKTTDIPAAHRAGIEVALAPDWTLSGSASMLGELKVAQNYSCENWNNLLAPRDLVAMVTSRAAQVLALDGRVGRLAPGLLADLLVVADRGEDAYQTLIGARLEDVRLVMVGGSLRYGDPSLMAATDRTLCEPLDMCGASKTLCVPDTTDATDGLDQSFSAISSVVSSFEPQTLPLAVCE